ncbi:MAG: hypothetical protein H6823_20945 [Planctomycetaceae bacterium]|nr:hypothetical protein [Planctomycetaceae bacterium]
MSSGSRSKCLSARLKLITQRNRSRQRKRRARHLRFETLEDRQLLAVDWRNPVNPPDVNGDGQIAPLDPLQVINELNLNGPHALSTQRPTGKPYWDVSGDQYISPLDALQAINAVNANETVPYSLAEGTQIAVEKRILITVGQQAGTRTYRLQVTPTFVTSNASSSSRDLFAIYLVDPQDPTRTLLDRGAPGTSLFSLSATGVEFTPGRVRWDGRVVEIDLSDVTDRDTAELRLQLLNGDGGNGSRVSLRPLSNDVNLDGVTGPVLLDTASPNTAGAAFDLTGVPMANEVKVQVDNVRFNSATNRYTAELRLQNQGESLGRSVAVGFPDLPSGVTLRNPSGTTADGVPYINFAPAISRGGLSTNARSERLLVEFDNPARVPFVISPLIIAGANQPPMLEAIGPLTVMPGGVLRTQLNATDPDGDTVTFSLKATGSNNDSALQLPTGMLRGSGLLEFMPKPDQLGTYTFDIVASDGALESRRTVTLNVVADPITTTRISGKVLQVNGQPLAGMQVELGAVQGITMADGSFLLDLGNGPIVSETIKVRGELFTGPQAYPFIAEKLPLVLEHDIYPSVNNVIDRPIYLPALDVAGGKIIDPMRDTMVRQEVAPGEMAEVFVAAGTLMNQQGTPFTGTLSITEVPPGLTPAALPEGLNPDLVVTIQPGEMVFARPAPLSLPNRAGYPAGRILDLWSINPASGEFEHVGNSQVSADGKTIDTISGGVRNSSWHFVGDPPIASPQRAQRYNPKQGCPACAAEESTNSTANLHSGSLTEMHNLVTYQSQGQQRAVQLVYDSLRADPRPILHFGIDEIDATQFFPFDIERVRISAHLTVRRGEFSFTVPGAERIIPASGGFGGGFNYNLPDDSHFWKLPQGPGAADGALQIDLRDQPTGVYRYDLDTGVYFHRDPDPLSLIRYNFIGSSSGQADNLLVVNAIDSPFGAGWGITGWQQIVEDANRRELSDVIERFAMIVDGGGTELLFKFDSMTDGFISPPGDFSTLEKLNDGTFRRTTPDKTVYQFNSRMQLATMIDRNHNATTYGYDGAGKLISITDPVGLVTTFTYTGDRVTTITDPIGRQTKLAYDVSGNLTRVTDPDDSTRLWRYDANHHMTGETDQLGRTEESIYGFHGRVTEARRKDGSIVHVNAPEVQGLLLPEATADVLNSPRMARLTVDAVASYVDGNGNVQRTSLDGAGQSMGRTDTIGVNSFVTRDANNLPATKTSARGDETTAAFDDRGNVLTSRDTLSVRIGDDPAVIGLLTGTILYPGEVDHYTFQGRAGELLHVDSVQGQSYPTIHFADDPTRHVGFDLLPEDGTYRVDVTQPGAYAIHLLSLTHSPSLPMGVTSGSIAKGQDLVYRVVLQRDQRLRIVDATPLSDRYWTVRGTDLSYRDFDYNSANTTYEFIAPADGEYFVIGDAPQTATLDLVPFSFTASVVTPDPLIAKSGFGVTQAGTLESGQEQTFNFTAPAGTLIYIDRHFLSDSNRDFVDLKLLDSAGSTLAGVGHLGGWMRLNDSGEFRVVATNPSSFEPADFSFRVLDFSAAPLLAAGESLDSTIQDGQAAIYRLTGTPGQRIITRSGTGSYSGTFTKQIVGELDTQPRDLADNQVLSITADSEQYLIFDSSNESEEFLWRSFDARLAQPLTLDTDLRGRFTVGNDRKYYRFTAQPGTYLFNEKLASNITQGAVFDERGELWKDTFHDRFSIPLYSQTYLPEASHEYFLVASMEEQVFLPHDFGFHLHRLQESTSQITIGQTVTGQLDWIETDSYTFEGRAGQWLYFDAMRFEVTPDYSVTATLTGPNGFGASAYIGRTQDSVPFQLTETGTYRIEMKSQPFNYESILHRDYQFRLIDLSETPLASQLSPLERPLQSGASVAVYRFAATNGQRITFTQADPATTLRIFNQRGVQVADSGTDSTLTMTFVETATHYIVVSARDESLTTPVASTWAITDASEPAVTPSGFGTYTGTALNDDTLATFQANAGDRILVSQDDSHSLIDLRVEDPTGATIANLSHYHSGYVNAQYLTVRRSGQHTIKAVSIQSFDAEYRFMVSRVQDLPAAPLGTEIPVPMNDRLGHSFKLAGVAGQRLFVEVTLADEIDERLGLTVNLTANLYDPILGELVPARPSSPLPRTGGYVLQLASENYDGTTARVIDLATVPEMQLDTPVTGTRTKVHESVLLRFSATAKEKRLFQFNTSNWQIVNLSNSTQYVTQGLAPREVSPDNVVWEEVAEFPSDGEYLLIGYGRFANPLDYAVTMTGFNEQILPMTGGTLSKTEYTYDSTYSQVTSITDEQGRKTLFDVDPVNGNVRSATRVIGQPGGSDDLVMAMTYTASGQIDTMTDPLGRVTDYDYDARGNLVKVTMAKGTAVEAVQQFELDAAGNVTAIIDANGHRSTFEYDSLNRRTKMTGPDPDGAGPLVAPVTSFVYDAIGNVTSLTDAAGRVTSQAYDTRDRMISMTDANNQVSRYSYDPNGNVIATTDPLGRVTKVQYDARNRMIASVDPAGFETRFRYDLDGNLLSVTDASGNVTSYKYDARGRRIAEIDPFGKVSTFVYNGVNELVTMTDRLGRVTKFDFDDAGRLTRERWLDAANAVVNTIDYTFDAASRLVRMQDGVSDLQVTLDELDRVARNESGGVAGVPAAILDATYDLVGNRLTLTDTIQGVLGGTNTYSYDALDRMIRVTQASATGSANATQDKRVDLVFNTLGQFTTLSRFSDLAGTQAVAATSFTYDTLNRLTDLTHRDSANAKLNGFAFTYDASSRITRITDIDGATDYSYDSRDQLTGANHADAANPDETYAYDGTGNRTSSQRHGTGYATGVGNRLTTDGTSTYEYDAEGNLVKQTTIASGAVREFLWDHRNRLIRVTDRPDATAASSQVVEYTYDAMNRRVGKTIDGAATYFIYDGNDVLVELTDIDSTGPQPAVDSVRYLHGPAVDQVFAQEDAAGEVEWHLTDHLGTVRDLIDDTGAVVNHLKYDSFGNVISQSNSAIATRYQFTSREFDAETGLHYFRARYYNTETGRFISEDPIGLRGGINFYKYAMNSPAQYSDPNGLSPEDSQTLTEAQLHNILRGRRDSGRTTEDIVMGLAEEMQESGFTLGGGRYLCTGTGEWLDLLHFFKLAQFGKKFGIGPAIVAGWLNEVGQAVKGQESGAPFGGNEDLFSNQEGAIFGANINNSLSLEENLLNYINGNLGGLRKPRTIGEGSARGDCGCDGKTPPPAQERRPYEKALP